MDTATSWPAATTVRVDIVREKGLPEIDWRPMRAWVNVIAYECDVVDHEFLWNTLRDDLPREATKMRRIVGVE